MNSNRLVPRRLTCWLLVSTLAVVAACAVTRTLPASDPAPARADATASASAVSANATVSAPPASADTTANAAPASADATASAPPAGADRRPAFDVPYWPTPQPIVEKMLELASVKSTDVVYDLGCGDARSLVTAAQRYGATGFGFDIDVRLVTKARENVRRNGVENLVQIELRDIFSLDLSKADVVFLFLLDRTIERLMPQLEKMRPGARIVAHEFPLPGVKPTRVVQIPGPPDVPPGTDEGGAQKTHTLYLWKVPWRTRPNVARAR